jgi:hypothetical protein
MTCRTENEGYLRIPEEVARIVFYHPRFHELGLYHIRANHLIRLADGHRFWEIYGLTPNQMKILMDFCMDVAGNLLSP